MIQFFKISNNYEQNPALVPRTLVSLQTQSCYVDSSSRSYQEHVGAFTFPLCDTGSIPQATPYEDEFNQTMVTDSNIVTKVNRMQWSILKITSL